MEFKERENTLVLYFTGEINSITSESIEKDVFDTIKDKTFNSLELDFDKVSYVSSAGLRIILKLKQRYNGVSIVNASLEVYDVLQMTGFTNIMEVKRGLRTIDISDATLIGTGYFSLVYRINKDTIIKVFKNTSDIKEIERELKLAKQAFILGVPTAISFDIVKVNDKYGVVFEMLDAVSLQDLFIKHPERFDELTTKYTNLLKTINSTEPLDDSLPNAKEEWLKKVDMVKDHLKEEDYNKIHKLLETIPEKKTFVHGDCHFKNIMTQNNELLLIDMDTLSKGHHIFELASIYSAYCTFEEDDPGNNLRFFGIEAEYSRRIFNTVLEKYMGYINQELIDKIRIVSYTHVMWWNIMNEPDDLMRLNGCKDRLLKLIKKYDDLLIDR